MEACSDAVLNLYSSLQTLAYVIRIGSNSNSATQLFFANGSMASETSTLGVLSCWEPRAFWLSWANGRLELAMHSFEGAHIVDFSDVNLAPVHVISVSSDVRARWMVHRDVGSLGNSAFPFFEELYCSKLFSLLSQVKCSSTGMLLPRWKVCVRTASS